MYLISKVASLPSGPSVSTKNFPSLRKKRDVHAVVVERRIGEIAQHRFVGGVVHRVLVLRGLPQLGFGLMATGAGLAADIGCGCSACRSFLQ